MADPKKVLLITDYKGALHISPFSNKAYYLQRNNLVKNKKFIIREMTEEEAKDFKEKNKGVDPDFVKPGDAQVKINSLEGENKALRDQLENLKKQTEKQPEKKSGKKIAAEPAPDDVDDLIGDVPAPKK